METPFNITREEVLDLAAQKLAESFSSEEELGERAFIILRERVEKACGENMLKKIDAFLSAKLEEIASSKITPVNIYGEACGEPTTIKHELALRAKNFWEQKVTESGESTNSDWGGKPRYEWVMKRLLKDEFDKAVKSNAESIVAEFKKAIKDHAVKFTIEQIDRLIKS